MTAAVLVAADEPGQPFLSPDDLATIKPLWTEAVDRHLMPIVGAVWDDSAGQIHAEMLDATDVDFPFPSVGSSAAEAYLAQARNVYDMVGDDLWATARSEMLEGFRLGESVDQIADRLRATAGMTARNAVLVARSTVIEASNAGSIATARASGLEMRKEWIATPDARTRPTHRHADGQVVDLNAKFTVGGFDADFPADPGLPPQEKFRCRCTQGFLLADAVAKQAQKQADPEPLPNTSGDAGPETPPLAQTVPEDTPSARRAARRQRQKAIDAADPVADLAAEVDQLGWLRRGQPFDDDAVKIFGQRIQLALDAGVPEADLAALRAAVQARDMVRVQAEARRLAQTRGLTGVENAGDRVPFDEARHKALVEGTDFADGELVDVHRQGHVLQYGDEAIQLDRAQVRAIDLTPKSEPSIQQRDLRDDPQATLDAARAGLGRRPSNLTPAQRKAFQDYQGTGYYGINGQLRRHEFDKQIQRKIDLMDEAMDSSPLDHDVVLWRGSRTGRGVFGDRLDHDLTGFEWAEDAYVSSSASRQVAVDFTYAGTVEAPGLVMRVAVPKGVGAVELSGLEVGGQAELLLRRGLRMRVVRDHGVSPDGYRLLDVEVGPVAAPKAAAVAPRLLSTFEARAADAARDKQALAAARVRLGTAKDPVPGADGLTPDERRDSYQALLQYKRPAYGSTNGWLRRTTGDPDAARRVADRRRVTAIDRAMKASPLDDDVVVYRGLFTGRDLFGARAKRDLTGFEWLEQAYLSTSAKEAGARGFAANNPRGGGVLLRILAPRGTHGVELSPYGGKEAELLLERGLRLRVVDDRGVAPEGYRVLDVELVRPSTAEQVSALNDRLAALRDLAAGGETTDPDTGEQIQQVLEQTQSALDLLLGGDVEKPRKRGAKR